MTSKNIQTKMERNNPSEENIKNLQLAISKKKNKRVKNKKPDDKNFDKLQDMFNDINQLFKSNPEMIKKVGQCVDKVINNENLMKTLVEELKDSTPESDSDTDSDNEPEQEKSGKEKLNDLD